MKESDKHRSTATKNGSATLCQEPVRDNSFNQGLVGIIGCSITFVIYLVRIASNLSYGGGGLGWDVFLITASMLCTIVASALAPVGKLVTLPCLEKQELIS
jgi:hypothetical protein